MDPRVDHEVSDINIRGVVAAAVALAVVTLIGIGAVTGLFLYLRHVANESARPISPSQQVVLPAEPRLQWDPEGDLRKMREEESRILNDYRWVDKDTGLARIPIDRAMKVLIERGLLTPVKETAADREQQPETSAK